MTGRPGRTQPCTRADARGRLRDARAQLQLADLAGADSPPEERKAAASCAVLAGIAAADAACCTAFGRRSRSQDHRDAVDLLKQVAPGGPAAARQLARLLGVKDESQYAFGDITPAKLRASVKQATAVIQFAASVLER